MIASYRYEGRSGVVNGLGQGRVALASNTLREPAFFRAKLGHPVLFREALAALHDVVVSDYKYRPRDRVAFRAWLDDQDRKFLATLGLKRKDARERAEALEARRAELDEARRERLRPFHDARRDYVDYVYEHQYELNYILDPVVTVHPDEVAFEAFSRDESTYARLAAKFELFDRVDEFGCGTTNVDFSARLHGELERLRSYRETRFDVGPDGFGVATGGGPGHFEKKVELPETWVRGFLQVHSVMSLGLTRFRMTTVDLYNIIRFLKDHRAKVSPRALRYDLTPGEPAVAVLEPWGHTVVLSPGSVYEGPKPVSVRTWGRDRLGVLARLLPACKSIDVYLAGTGMPSVYALDVGPAVFTLALSGWTDNDWTGGASRFDLLARRLDVGRAELMQVYGAVRSLHSGTAAEVASRAGMGVEAARSGLSYLCQVGRAMFDLAGGVYRHRDLFAEPFSAEAAAAAPEPAGAGGESDARAIFDQGDVRVIARRPVSSGYKLSGTAKGADGRRVRPLLHVDHEGKIIEGSCTCSEYKKQQWTRGPCPHVLALRLAHMGRLRGGDVPVP